MNLEHKIFSASTIWNAHLFGKRCPLVVSFSLTNRCNYKCKYCQVWNTKVKELTTKQIFSLIDELAELGTQRIGFTGGEPLLREDIGEIINYSKKRGVFTGLVSNGSLVPDRIGEIKNLELLQLSFDGSEETFEKQRDKRLYKKTITAIKIAKENKLRVWLTTVLTKFNLEEIDFILDKAEKFGNLVFFQPVLDYEICGERARELFPPEEEYKKAIKKIMRYKKKNKPVGNSKSCLEYLYNWPSHNKKLKCWAGKIFCHIYTNGDFYSCFNMVGNEKLNCKEIGVENAFNTLQEPKCGGCWAYANIEFNLLFSLNFDVIMNTLKITR